MITHTDSFYYFLALCSCNRLTTKRWTNLDVKYDNWFSRIVLTKQ